MNQRLVAEGINYLKAMREGNMNVHELSENLDIPVKKIKEAIAVARENKETGKKGFELDMHRPRMFIGKGVRGEFQNIKKIDLEFTKSLQLNYDTKQTSEFIVMLPVKVTITRM